MTKVVTDATTLNHPTTVTTNRLSSGTFDGAGNLLSLAGTAYAFDPMNRLAKRTGGDAVEYYFLYTADDERIATFVPSAVGDEWRWTLRDLSGKVLREFGPGTPPEEDEESLAGIDPERARSERAVDFSILSPAGSGNTEAKRDYVYRGSQLIGSDDPKLAGFALHLSLDHLGTPRLGTDQFGTIAGKRKYYPFGQEATDPASQGPLKLVFTGHERDYFGTAGTNAAADDLDYMHARTASPLMGRFLSFDGLLRPGAIARRPQRWNRYAYSSGNPIRFVDPDGLELRQFTFNNQTVTVDSRIAASAEAFLRQASEAGVPVRVNSSFRTTEEQRRLFEDQQNNPNPVAAPGSSRHESGFALDLNVRNLTPEQRQSLDAAAQANGLAPLAGDPPHFEADPRDHGYESRQAAITENQADFADGIEAAAEGAEANQGQPPPQAEPEPVQQNPPQE